MSEIRTSEIRTKFCSVFQAERSDFRHLLLTGLAFYQVCLDFRHCISTAKEPKITKLNLSPFLQVSICEFSVNALYLDCYHCRKPFKHVTTLIDHLKNHGLKR